MVRGLWVGIIGLALMLLAELAVLFFIRQQSLSEYIASRDPVAGAVYLGSLMLFACMPAVVVRVYKR